MSSARYIFVGDQGHVFKSSDHPTAEDFAYAAVGMVTIVRLSDCWYYGREQKWQPIPEGEQGTAGVDEKLASALHASPRDFTFRIAVRNGLRRSPDARNQLRTGSRTVRILPVLNDEVRVVSSALRCHCWRRRIEASPVVWAPAYHRRVRALHTPTQSSRSRDRSATGASDA